MKMIINNKEFNIGERTYIMGILNVTPDSFSDGGKYNSLDMAREQVKKMIEDGVDIIDVGGESTRPNYVKVSDEDEINRVVPIIKMIREEFNMPISVDTYKSKVAEAAIIAGAGLINDIWGLKADDEMAKVVAKYDVACCLMHNRENNDYKNLMEDVKNDIQKSIDLAKAAGIKDENIMIDPGIGFAKNVQQNLQVMNNLEQLKELGYPILLGTSRKSTIGHVLNLPVNEREEGTMATTAVGMMKGACDFVRVHDVLKNKRLSTMIDAIIYSERNK